MRPNLFKFATKELSQDAFLAWLIQWASPEYKSQDVLLWECATRFVKKLLSLSPQITPPPKITSVKVERPWKRTKIDVGTEINGEYRVIIEDKTATADHSGQLQRYKDIAIAWCKENKFQSPAVCVYLKTGSQSAADLKKIEEQGFAVFARKDLLSILSEPRVTNQIFVDFREYLQDMEDSECQFATKPIKEWGDPQWKGFYQDLEKRRNGIKWNYVPNPSGGFWNAVLNWQNAKDCCPYMQIEQGPLCFKVGEIYEHHVLIRDHYHRSLMDHCAGENNIQRPKRLGDGTYMTIAYVERADWLGTDDSLVDMPKVVARLDHYENIYLEFIKKCRPWVPPAQ